MPLACLLHMQGIQTDCQKTISGNGEIIMDEKIMASNECSSPEDEDDILCDNAKMLEISEAINDIDSKLRDLEIALQIRNNA